VLIVAAGAQQSLDSAYRTTGVETLAAFEAQRLVLQTSSAVIYDGRTELSYGVIISTNGYLLTKLSEVAKAKTISVTVDQTPYREVQVLATDPEWDVALLKIDAHDLIPVNFAVTSDLPQGTWVVANGATTRTHRRLLAGIISAKTREIPAAGGAALGVVLKERSKKIEIEDVYAESGAKEAGLQKGDILQEIEGQRLKKIQDLSEFLKNRKAGSKVKLSYSRKGEEHTIEVQLAARGEIYTEQLSTNDLMSGDFSPRRSGFPRVLQHDILGSRSITGGPLLDLQGLCIGMNIARANRAESFAIPVEDLREIATRLMARVPK
jgi:serine protease Do